MELSNLFAADPILCSRSKDLVLTRLDFLFSFFFRGDSTGPVHSPCDVQLLGTCVLNKMLVGAYLIIVNQTSGKSTKYYLCHWNGSLL